MSLQVELRHVIYALSDALDLVGIDDVAHGKRVGIMAAECGKGMGLPASEVEFLFDLGMLHDIGVSSTRTHGHLVGEFDWAGAQDHAVQGAELLADFKPLAAMSQPIRYHHTRWDVLTGLPVDPTVRQQANLIFLVDRVDAMAAPHYADHSLLIHVPEICDALERYRGSYFAPALVDAFLHAARPEAFWLRLEPRSIQDYLRDVLSQGAHYPASMTELRQLAVIFSRIVDAKSPFTGAHSLGVARLARHIAKAMGLPELRCDMIEIAGLLHDLGKLRVPDEILDKPGQLNADERMVINAHSFETYQILRNIDGFEDIAPWAAYHHETPDGNGYPFHIRDADLPLEARILRVADIFQAMVQTRPYRPGLTAKAALAFMSDLVARGQVEPEILAVLALDPEAARAVALAEPRH
ncbi:MAG: HD-GYP domain-containing protein [Pseudomonadota bacterium]